MSNSHLLGLRTCAWSKGRVGRVSGICHLCLRHYRTGKGFFSRMWGSGLEIWRGKRGSVPREAPTREPPPSLQRWGGALRREREGGTLQHGGRARSGAQRAFKDGARSLRSAAATSTSRCIFAGAAALLCGSRASPNGAVPQARPRGRSLPPVPLPLPRAALRGPWAAPTPPPILYGCGRLGAPCAPQSCGGRPGIMRPWCAENACAGGCCRPCREGGVAGPTPCGCRCHPGAARGKILTKRWPRCPD